MNIDKEEILHIATLSRLSFTDEELAEIGRHLDNTLERFRALDAVDVSDVPPTAHVRTARRRAGRAYGQRRITEKRARNRRRGLYREKGGGIK